MNAADRVALVDRLARALVWASLSPKAQDKARSQARALVAEMEIGREQTDRLGWILLPEFEPGDHDDAEVES